MSVDKQKKEFLEKKAKRIRYLTMLEIGHLGTGHVGGSLSIAEVLAVLYFDVMNVDPKNPQYEDRDRLVLSKGHAGPALYAALAEKGYFDMSWLYTLNQPHTNLPSHCDMLRTPGVDMTTGSLGQGISCAVGMAKAGKIFNKNYTVYCIIGDGESQEGQVWEASMIASHWKLDNLIVFLDYNKMQIDGMVNEINSIEDPVKRWEAFGFFVQEVDGHDVESIENAIRVAKQQKGMPKMIVLHTVKGKGVSFIEQLGPANHNIQLSPEQVKQALNELAEGGGQEDVQ